MYHGNDNMADDADRVTLTAVVCRICGTSDNLKSCAKCKSVQYCSKDHQAKDWPMHKTQCKRLRLKTAHGNDQNQAEQGSPNHLENESVKTPVFDPRPVKLVEFPKPSSTDVDTLPEFVSDQLLGKGYCVVDGVLSDDECMSLLAEVKQLEISGVMQTGRLAGGLTSGSEEEKVVNSDIRSNLMTWVDHVQDSKKWPNICTLLTEKMDMTVINASFFLQGNYTITGRTKAMVTCYPGGGSSYQMHVDNPSKDGRIITCILYLNKEWDIKTQGGLLRMFPTSLQGGHVDIEPLFNRMVFFWSDSRNPHEVHPAYDKRYAITVWYFDKEEREKAKLEQVRQDISQVESKIASVELKTCELRKAALAQQLENESLRAVNLLSEEELEAMSTLLKGHPNPSGMLQAMGIATPIQDHLLKVLKLN